MRRFFDNIFGRGYETRVLVKRSPQSLFLFLLIYMFVLGALVHRSRFDTFDLWFLGLWTVSTFRDARVTYRVLSRAPQPEAPSLSIVASSNQED